MYDVGKVLFVVLKKKQKIIPVQVIEQIVRRSMSGETIQYQVKVPGYDDPMPIDALGTDVYVNIEEVKDALKENTSLVIDTMAEAAVSLATNDFRNDYAPKHIEGVEEDENLTVDLGDGKKARVNVSNLKKLHQ